MRATVITALVFGTLLLVGLTQVKIKPKEASAQEKPQAAAVQEKPKEAVTQEQQKETVAPDAAVVIHERTLNSFLAAIGPVSGKDKIDVAGSKSEYTWSVRNPRIEIMPNKAEFVADASVKVGPLNYNSPAKGAVEVKYSTANNRISVKVLKADFEVYTKIFKKKIHIATVDISRFYRPEFEFAGPQPIQESVPVDLPDGSVRTIYISTKDQTMRLEEGQIVVTSSLVFSDKSSVKEWQKPPEPAKEAQKYR